MLLFFVMFFVCRPIWDNVTVAIHQCPRPSRSAFLWRTGRCVVSFEVGGLLGGYILTLIHNNLSFVCVHIMAVGRYRTDKNCSALVLSNNSVCMIGEGGDRNNSRQLLAQRHDINQLNNTHPPILVLFSNFQQLFYRA